MHLQGNYHKESPELLQCHQSSDFISGSEKKFFKNSKFCLEPLTNNSINPDRRAWEVFLEHGFKEITNILLQIVSGIELFRSIFLVVGWIGWNCVVDSFSLQRFF